MDKKFQIFVSSTYEDLREQRESVIRSILEMGHFPVGMEMFSAADDQQWVLIQKQIDESDYYVVLVAHRYGSEDALGISFTEKEYDYACRKAVPTLGFVIKSDAVWPQNLVDSGVSHQKLEAFKAKVKSKLISYWASSDDLPGKVAVALMKQFNVNPRIGWVRGSSVVSVDATNELSRLSKENAELRERVGVLAERDEAAKTEKRGIQEALDVLDTAKREVSFWYADSEKWEDKTEVQLARIFGIWGPELMVELGLAQAAIYLGWVRPNQKRDSRARQPTPSNHVKYILADFAALDLVVPSKKKHSVKDTEQYWTLSEKGKAVLTQLRLAAMIKETTSPTPSGETEVPAT